VNHVCSDNFEVKKIKEKVHEMDETECEMARICHFCLEYFDDPQIYYEHRNVHIGEPNPYLCQICGKTFRTAKLRGAHFNENHSKFRCEKCLKEYSSDVKLNMHFKHCRYGELLQCKICNKTFANKRNLRDHTQIFHDSEKTAENSKSKYY